MHLALRAGLPTAVAISGAVAVVSTVTQTSGAPTSVMEPEVHTQIPGAHLHRPPPMPVPIEDTLRGDTEFSQKARRKAWFRDLHKTPDGVDWKQIERENGLRQLEKRNRLSAHPAPPDLAGSWQERGSDNQAGRSHAAA